MEPSHHVSQSYQGLHKSNVPFVSQRSDEQIFRNDLQEKQHTIFNQMNALLIPFSFFLFFAFVALRPKSTAMVMAGWSVHLTTLFPGQA